MVEPLVLFCTTVTGIALPAVIFTLEPTSTPPIFTSLTVAARSITPVAVMFPPTVNSFAAVASNDAKGVFAPTATVVISWPEVNTRA